MSQQYDFLAGLDISSLSSVTQAQLMQMVNQIAPLSNIGAVVYGAATSSSLSITQGTGGSPDVTNNPRFARYLWLNTYTTLPVPFYYDTSDSTWKVVTVPNGSIAPAQLADHVDALDHMFDTSSPSAYGGYVLVYDATGTLITQITKAALFASLTVLLSQISTSGSVDTNVIKNVAGTVSWAKINLATDAFDGTLPLAKFASGTNDFVLQTKAGVPTWVSNDDAVSSFLPTGTASVGISASKLKLGTANQMLVNNTAGTAVVHQTQSLRIGTTAEISRIGTAGLGSLFSGAAVIAHLLGAIPKLVRVVAVLNTTDTTSAASTSYTVGDEVDLVNFEKDTNLSAFGVTADATNISVAFRATGTPVLLVKDKVAASNTGAILETNWSFKAYAWL